MTIEKLDSFVPTNDYVFKRIFGRVGNEIITKGLLVLKNTKNLLTKFDKKYIINKICYQEWTRESAL